MSTFQAPSGTFGVPEQPAKPRGANVSGIAGFVLGLLSVLLCCLPYVGLIAVPGLILRVIGLFHPKKALAIAGTILSAIGAILALIYVLIIVSIPQAIGGLGLFDMVKGAAIAGAVTETKRASNGTLPADLATTGLPPAFLQDKWGTPFIYTPRGDGTFTLTSAGADRTAGTSDDVDLGAALLQNQSTSSDFPDLRAVTALPAGTTPGDAAPVDAPQPPDATEEPTTAPGESGKP